MRLLQTSFCSQLLVACALYWERRRGGRGGGREGGREGGRREGGVRERGERKGKGKVEGESEGGRERRERGGQKRGGRQFNTPIGIRIGQHNDMKLVHRNKVSLYHLGMYSNSDWNRHWSTSKTHRRVLTLPSPEFISLVHDRQEEVLIPVSRWEDNGVVQELINGVREVILREGRIGCLMEVLGKGDRGERGREHRGKGKKKREGGAERGKEREAGWMWGEGRRGKYQLLASKPSALHGMSYGVGIYWKAWQYGIVPRLGIMGSWAILYVI